MLLKSLEVSAEVFDKILYDYEEHVLLKHDFNNYMCGYSENTGLSKNNIVYNGDNKLICREYVVNGYTDAIEGCTTWKQIIVIRNEELENDEIEKTVSGKQAWNTIMRHIKKFYTDQEIETIFKEHSLYSLTKDQKQQHSDSTTIATFKIFKYKNTYKYDINGAHADAVIELFPKARKLLLWLYNKKDKLKQQGKEKEANKIKNLFNYFVGYLCRMGYRPTYNWIVARTTAILTEAEDQVGGTLLYVNTDGFLVYNTTKTLVTSKNLGDMKLEACGDAYIVRTNNYVLYQTYKADTGKKELKGSCMKCVRDKIDLSTGKTIVYDKVLHVIGKNANGKNCGYFEIKNEREITLDIKEIR